MMWHKEPHHTTPHYPHHTIPAAGAALLYYLCYTVDMDKDNKQNETPPPIELVSVGDYKVDSAELVPYRLDNGGIGWRAIPIPELSYEETVTIAMEFAHSIVKNEDEEPETVAIDCEDCDGAGDYETETPQAHGETSYKVFTCETCDGLGTVEVEDE